MTLIKSPLCIYQTHCGAKVELGTPENGDGYINTPLRCTQCGATGVSSERKASA